MTNKILKFLSRLNVWFWTWVYRGRHGEKSPVTPLASNWNSRIVAVYGTPILSIKRGCTQCGNDFVSSVGSNCDQAGLCPTCIRRKQTKLGKFWMGD